MKSEPPLRLSDLKADPVDLDYGNTIPDSPLRCYLGKQYSVDELLQSESFEETDREPLKRVRAYPVMPLINASFQIKSDNELGAAIKALLNEKLPGIEWRPKEDWQGPFRKYYIVHGSIPAPPDMRTGQPMALEIFGELVAIDNIMLDSPAGHEWIRKRRMALSQAEHFDHPLPDLTGDMVVAIKNATYANIMYPGIGVPVYL